MTQTFEIYPRKLKNKHCITVMTSSEEPNSLRDNHMCFCQQAL